VARATASAPMLPPAPPRLSITHRWPSAFDMRSRQCGRQCRHCRRSKRHDHVDRPVRIGGEGLPRQQAGGGAESGGTQ